MTKLSDILIIIVFSAIIHACQSSTASTDRTIETANVPNFFPFCNNALATLKGIDELSIPNKVISGIGNSHLTITIQNNATLQCFNQIVCRVHSFGHLEANRAFRQVIKSAYPYASSIGDIYIQSNESGGNQIANFLQSI